MLNILFYYLGRIKLFWWLCLIATFILSANSSRRKHLYGEIGFSAAAVRSVFYPYLFFVLILTVFMRLPDYVFSFELIPFHSYAGIIRNHDTQEMLHCAANIAVFIPFGVLFPACSFKGKEKAGSAVLFGFLLSLAVELFQLVTKTGSFETDDIINNTFGVLLGVLVFTAVRCILRKIKKKER